MWVFAEIELYEGVWEEALGVPPEVLTCTPLMQCLGYLAHVRHDWYLAEKMTGPQLTACMNFTCDQTSAGGDPGTSVTTEWFQHVKACIGVPGWRDADETEKVLG